MIPLRFLAARNIPRDQKVPGYISTVLEGILFEANSIINDAAGAIGGLSDSIADAKSTYYNVLSPCSHAPHQKRQTINEDLLRCSTEWYADYDDMMICRNNFTNDGLWSENFLYLDWVMAKYMCCITTDMEFEEVLKMIEGMISSWERAPPKFTPDDYNEREFELYDCIRNLYQSVKVWAKILSAHEPGSLDRVQETGRVVIELIKAYQKEVDIVVEYRQVTQNIIGVLPTRMTTTPPRQL